MGRPYEYSTRELKEGTRFFRVGQFADHPPIHDEPDAFKQYLLDCVEVDKDFEPYWGGGVWALEPDGEFYLYRNNYDSSD